MGVGQNRLQRFGNGVSSLTTAATTIGVVQPILEQGDFLCQEPTSQIFTSTVGKPQDKMRDPILGGIIQLLKEWIQMFLVLVWSHVT